MPELPEVETVVRTLRPRLLGANVTGVTLHRTDIINPPGFDLAAALEGRSFIDIQRRGKRIILRLDDGNQLYVHLGMTGQLRIEAADAPVQSHTHVLLDLESPRAPAAGTDRRGRSEPPKDLARAPSAGIKGSGAGSARKLSPRSDFVALGALQLRFRDPRRFGGIWWMGRDAAQSASGMGPEPLTLRPARLARQLATTSRAIKTALLDQKVIAGIGNIYADEALFAAAIHPLRPARDLTMEEVHRLNRAIKLTLRSAIRHRGSTLRDYVDGAGAAGGYQRHHRVYDRANHPCSVCGSPIQRIVLGGRSTHFCAKCQALP